MKFVVVTELPETMVEPVLGALKVLKARPALRGLKVDLKAAKATDRNRQSKGPVRPDD